MDPIIGKEFAEKIIPIIDSASHTIKIVVFDWRWYSQDPGNPVQLFNQAIVRAIRRGVVVQAVVNSDDIVKMLKSVGASARKIISKNLVHAKLIIIDDVDVVLGSHNFSQAAFTMNFEASIYLPSCEKVSAFTEFFNALYLNHG